MQKRGASIKISGVVHAQTRCQLKLRMMCLYCCCCLAEQITECTHLFSSSVSTQGYTHTHTHVRYDKKEAGFSRNAHTHALKCISASAFERVNLRLDRRTGKHDTRIFPINRQAHAYQARLVFDTQTGICTRARLPRTYEITQRHACVRHLVSDRNTATAAADWHG